MPVYEYQCRSCGMHFDLLVRFSELDKKPECPVCGSKETQKQISMFAASGAYSSAASSNCGSSSSPFR